MNETVIELSGVYYSYLGKYPALCGVDFNVRKGEKVAIIGANGTGKSTLLSMLDGLVFPDKGKVNIFGNEISEDVFFDQEFSRCFRSHVGFVFQNSDIQLFCPTAEEDILFGPIQLGMAEDVTKKRFDELVLKLNISHLLHRAPHELSAGEKKKIAIASTLIIDPEVIILDEPTAGLDPSTMRHIMDIIIQANLDGKTIITATHDLHIVEEIADKVYVFSDSKNIVRSGPVKELFMDMQFLRENNLVHIHAHAHKDGIHVHPHEHVDHHH